MGNLWKMINILVDRPHAQLRKWLQSAWSYPRWWTIHDVCNPAGLSCVSCQCILADELNMRWIAAKFVPRLLNDQQDLRVQVCTEPQKRYTWSYFSVQGLNWWWIMALRLWPENKAGVFPMEDAIPYANKKSTPSLQQHQVTATHSFWQWRNCASGVCSTWSDCQWEVLLWGFETEGKCEVQTAWDMEEWRLVIEPWQCACPHLAHCEGIPDKKEHDHCSPPCLHTWHGLLWFLLVPYNKSPIERAAFCIHWKDTSRIATGKEHTNAGSHQWMLPKMAKLLESLYTSQRCLLRTWRCKLGLKSIPVITSKFLEILDSTSYIHPTNVQEDFWACIQY